jgi:hypothetical protein
MGIFSYRQCCCYLPYTVFLFLIWITGGIIAICGLHLSQSGEAVLRPGVITAFSYTYHRHLL